MIAAVPTRRRLISAMPAPPASGMWRATALVAALIVGAGLVVGAPSPARAEQLPSGSIGVLFGAGRGTGAYTHRLGVGYYQFGGQAAWQPMTTERRVGWSLRWLFAFGTMYYAEASRIDLYLRTLQMDFMAGLRLRPWTNPRRYLAVRGGVELFRANQQIPTSNQRAFVGPVASASFEQYLFGAFMFNVDVRYGLIGSGPSEIAVLAGASISVR
jgi:hypothetical protein